MDRMNKDPRKEAILLGISVSPRDTKKIIRDDERVNEFINALNELRGIDPELEECLVPYLRFEHGRKLAPMIIVAHVLANSDTEPLILRKYLTAKVIDTPKRLAEVVAYYKHFSGVKSFKTIPMRERFRKILESFDGYTLRKNKMRRRAVKLADLIKVLRPRPKNKKMSKLYKNIIENRNVALKEEEHVTAMFSAKMDVSKQKEVLEQNIEQMPINSLIRNFEKLTLNHPEFVQVVKERLGEIAGEVSRGNIRATSVFNPFELFNILYKFCENHREGDSVGLFSAISKIIDGYVHLKTRRLHKPKVAVLVDISLSMETFSGNVYRIVEAMKYLSVLPAIFNIKYIAFFNSVYYDENDTLKVLPHSTETFRSKEMRNKKFKVYREVLKADSPSENFVNLYRLGFQCLPCGTTALNDSLKMLRKKCPDVEAYFVITDEQDNTKLEWTEMDGINEVIENNDAVLFLANVSYEPETARTEEVFKGRVVRLTSLTPALFEFFNLTVGDIEEVVRRIKEKYAK